MPKINELQLVAGRMAVVAREMTAEEVARMEAEAPEAPALTPEERIEALENLALARILASEV